MTATNHGLVGSVVAITLHRYPLLAIAVAPFTHFILDAIPHYGDSSLDLRSGKFFRILFSDMALAVLSTLLIAFVWSQIAWLIILCAFLAASPDLMWLWLEYIKPTDRKNWPLIARFHSLIQWSQTRPGFIVETIWFFVLFPTLLIIGIY